MIQQQDRQIALDQLPLWSSLVAAHFARTGRDPDDEEVDAILATLRSMTEGGREASLQ